MKNKVETKMTKQQKRQFKINNCNHYTSEQVSSNKWTVKDFEERFLDPIKLKQLHLLQISLLGNGFRLLK